MNSWIPLVLQHNRILLQSWLPTSKIGLAQPCLAKLVSGVVDKVEQRNQKCPRYEDPDL
jgi:ribosomal protein L16 Arg81 hydroxylase